MDDIKNKIKDILYKNNKPLSKRFNKDWFYQTNNLNLYEDILDRTKNFKNMSLIHRINLIMNDISTQQKCLTCNKETDWDRTAKRFKFYCSKICQYTDPNLSDNIKKHLKQVDYEKANEKRKKTLLLKYGQEYNSKREDVKKLISEKASNRYLNNIQKNCLFSEDWLNNEYNIKKRTAVDIANELGVYYSTVLFYCRKYNFDIRKTNNYSLEEKEVCDFIKSLNVDIIENDRNVLKGHELDIFIPSKNLAIEYNGIYWHSDNDGVKPYKKYSDCEELNIQLITIFSDEWLNKKEIVKSIIKSKLNLYENTLYARNCEYKKINHNDAKTFFESNHLQGFCNGEHYALIYNDEIVTAITIGKSRFEKNKLELIRYATKNNYRVIGGFSKLYKNSGYDDIVTYCDLRYSNGHTYKKFGHFIKKTEPNYFYTKNGYDRESRLKYQKHKLKNILINYDDNLSEKQNMINNGYRIIYDCGNYKFILDKNKPGV